MQLNLTVEGNVANDPELQYLPDGVAVCNLRVMVTRRYTDRVTGEWRDGDTTTFDVACWRKLAENVAEGISKGDLVVVTANNLVVKQSDDKQYVNLRVNAATVALSARWNPASSNKSVTPIATGAPMGVDAWGVPVPATVQPAPA